MSTVSTAGSEQPPPPSVSEALNKALASPGQVIVPPQDKALDKTIDSSRKLIDQGHSLAKQGPVYAMVFLSAVLVAFAVSFAEMHAKDLADFIVSLIIASVLLITAGVLRLVNNVAESRGIAQQVLELSSANERIVKFGIERGVVAMTNRQDDQAPPSES
jgi:hypothetical protein